ncbi:hypothetical protein GN956_G2819 [Arapaima gigas]
MKPLHFIAWIIFFSPPRCALQNVTYVRRLEGESVDISCAPPEKLQPFGLFLRYKFPRAARDVAFFSASHHTVDRQYRGRVNVSGSFSTGPLSVTITGLQHSDTGLYLCSFNHSVGRAEENVEVFVFVETLGRCLCPHYPVLLHTLSGVVALLLLLVLGMGIVKLIQGNVCGCKKEIIPVPIYEEMSRKQPAGL